MEKIKDDSDEITKTPLLLESDNVKDDQDTSCLRLIKKICDLAFPKALEMICLVVAPFVYVTVFAGYLGENYLATSVLACSIYRGSVRIVLRGIAIATSSFFGEAYGGGNYKEIGINLQKSLLLVVLINVLMTGLFLSMEPILRLIGQGNLSAPVARYLIVLIPFISFDGFFWITSTYLQSNELAFPPMAMAVFGAIIQPFILYLITIKYQFGLDGLAIGYGISLIFIAFGNFFTVLIFHYKIKGHVKDPWIEGFSIKAFNNLLPMIKLVAYSAMSQAFKTWGSEYLIILANLLEDSTTHVSSLGIFLTVCMCGFCPFFGTAWAMGLMVATEIGKGNAKTAKFIIFLGTLMQLIYACFISFIILIFIHDIGRLWTTNEHILNEISNIFPYICIILFSSVISNTGVGALTGVRRQRSMFFITVFVTLTFGALFPPLLAFGINLGFYGLVYGYIITAVSESIAYIVVLLTIDWELAVDKANFRLNYDLNE